MPHQLKFYTKTELIRTNSQAPNWTKTTSKEKGSSRGKKFIHISKTLNSNPTRARTLRPTYPSRGHVWFWPFTPRPLCKFQNIKALVGFVPLTLCNGFLGEKKCLTRKNANVDNPNKKLFLWLNSRFQFCQIQELKTLNITEKINLDGHVTPCKMQMFMGNQKAKKNTWISMEDVTLEIQDKSDIRRSSCSASILYLNISSSLDVLLTKLSWHQTGFGFLVKQSKLNSRLPLPKPPT